MMQAALPVLAVIVYTLQQLNMMLAPMPLPVAVSTDPCSICLASSSRGQFLFYSADTSSISNASLIGSGRPTRSAISAANSQMSLLQSCPFSTSEWRSMIQMLLKKALMMLKLVETAVTRATLLLKALLRQNLVMKVR